MQSEMTDLLMRGMDVMAGHLSSEGAQYVEDRNQNYCASRNRENGALQCALLAAKNSFFYSMNCTIYSRDEICNIIYTQVA